MSETNLSLLVIFYSVLRLVEMIGGVKTNSLALMADAAHSVVDVAGFSISLLIGVSAWKATSNQAFGFNRFQVLATLVPVQLQWFISAPLIYEANDRLLHKKEVAVDGRFMFVIAAFGFIIKFVIALWLGHHHTHHRRHHHHQPNIKTLNIDLRGAYLHFKADLLRYVGVVIAAAVIERKPSWLILDLLFAIFVSNVDLSNTVLLVRDIYGTLMQRTPRGINVDMLESGIKGIEGVQNIHDLHVWAITFGEHVLSCHASSRII